MNKFQIPLIFLLSRLFIIMALPLDGLRGYGDLTHFYQLAGMGRPYLDYWVEFPPVFPAISMLLFKLSGGEEHAYDYLFVLLMSLAQASSVYLFLQIAKRNFGDETGIKRTWIYMAMLIPLAYGWWYFDPLAVLALMLGLFYLFEKREGLAGLALGLGAMVKLFPAIAVVAALKYRPKNRAMLTILIILGVGVFMLGSLFAISPDMTMASLLSQTSKGSWETVWALIDGNLSTGNFGPQIERYNPAMAAMKRGNPAVIPTWLTLIAFLMFGGWLFRRSKANSPLSVVSFLGLTMCIFFAWSPGWSPQWALYLLPIILLSLPLKEAILMATTFLMVNLLEWPVLLSRGLFDGLWILVPFRTLILLLMATAFWKGATTSQQTLENRLTGQF